MNSTPKVFLFGAAESGKCFLQENKRFMNIAGFIDNNTEKQKKRYKGLPVYSVKQCTEHMTPDSIVFICSWESNTAIKIARQCESELGLKRGLNLFLHFEDKALELSQEKENKSKKQNKEIRFEFGENWQSFIRALSDEQIKIATESLCDMLKITSLEGKKFIDVGCGSGLFSLCARRLGAKVTSFDYDTQSVAATTDLKARYFPDDDGWQIHQGDVLDPDWLFSLGQHDIVYSWGVLHHTGAMWRALANVGQLVADGGTLFISIYNDQGYQSMKWRKLKRKYNQGNRVTKWQILTAYKIREICRLILTGQNPATIVRGYKRHRGMSWTHDIVDWVGGYPFQTAKPEQVFEFFYDKGYTLTKLLTWGAGLGCNQFVFKKQEGE